MTNKEKNITNQEYDGPEENNCGLDWSSLPKLVHPQVVTVTENLIYEKLF